MVVNLSGDQPVFQYNDFEVFREDLELVEPGSFLGYIPLYYTNDNTITSATQEYNKMLEHEKWLSSEIARHLKLAVGYAASVLMAWAAPKQRSIAMDLGKEREVLRTFLPKVQALTVDTAQETREEQQVEQLKNTLDLPGLAQRAGYVLVPKKEKSNVPAFAVPAALISAAAFFVPMR